MFLNKAYMADIIQNIQIIISTKLCKQLKVCRSMMCQNVTGDQMKTLHSGGFTEALLQTVGDRYSIHPFFGPSLLPCAQSEVRASSRVMAAFVCIPQLPPCCLSGQTVSVRESQRHMTSASSSEGRQVS